MNSYCVYVKSKETLLLIGGARETLFDGLSPFGVWRYCMKENKWKEINELSFSLQSVTCVISANERYVLIAGGKKISDNLSFDISEYNYKIFALDISDDSGYKLRECTIKAPGIFSHIILMGGEIEDELLVIGWIKQLFKTKEFKDLSLPPIYIMKIIGLWYNQEELHWIGRKQHYVVGLNHILCSLK